MNDKNNFQKGSTRKGTSGYGSKRAGDKLKSETSARRAYGSKFRHGKKDVELTAKEKKKIKKMQVQGRRSIRRKMAENEAVHRRISDANEDQNVGTEALNKGVETADDATGLISHRLYTRKLQKDWPERKVCKYESRQFQLWRREADKTGTERSDEKGVSESCR